MSFKRLKMSEFVDTKPGFIQEAISAQFKEYATERQAVLLDVVAEVYFELGYLVDDFTDEALRKAKEQALKDGIKVYIEQATHYNGKETIYTYNVRVDQVSKVVEFTQNTKEKDEE